MNERGKAARITVEYLDIEAETATIECEGFFLWNRTGDVANLRAHRRVFGIAELTEAYLRALKMERQEAAEQDAEAEALVKGE